MSDSCSIPSKFDLCQIRVESWHGFFLVLLTQIRTLCRHRMAHTTNPRTPLPRSDGLDQITSLPSVSVAKRQPSDPWWPVLATRPFNSTGKKSSFCTQKEVDRDEWVEIDVTKERETLLYRGREGGSRNARKFGDDGAAESWNLAIWGSQRLWGVGSKGKVVFLGVLALSCCFRGDLFDSFWFWEGKKRVTIPASWGWIGGRWMISSGGCWKLEGVDRGSRCSCRRRRSGNCVLYRRIYLCNSPTF